MGSFMGRGNQYMWVVKVLYCKLPTNGKQLPACPLEVGPGTSEVGGESVFMVTSKTNEWILLNFYVGRTRLRSN